MKPRGRARSRWRVWLFGAIGGLAILVGIGVGIGYLYLKSISLADIQDRRIAAVESEGGDESGGESPAEVPTVLSGSVDKANAFADKPIKAQDAIDVAAILLNSGLSLRQILFLQGNATDKLSTEEKQQIRDLLLEKLTQEEIAALRSITSQYGKGLIILDPNYPIELVGVYDEKERERIKKELAEREAAGKTTPGSAQPATPVPASDQTAGEQGAQDSPEQEKLRAQIHAEYAPRLDALKLACTEKSGQLIGAIVAEVQAAGGEVTLQMLQEKFLARVVEAERGCDEQFAGIVADARAAYQAVELDEQVVAVWRSEYEAGKSAVRSQALAKLAGVVE